MRGLYPDDAKVGGLDDVLDDIQPRAGGNFIGAGQRVQRTARRVKRDIVAFEQHLQRADMIGMLVRNEDRAHIMQRQVVERHRRLKLLEVAAGVDEDRSRIALYVIGIALAGRKKRNDFCHIFSEFQSGEDSVLPQLSIVNC